VGFVVDKMASGQVFSEYFGFPCHPHFIPPTYPSSPSPGTGTIGQYMAAVPRGLPYRLHFPLTNLKKKEKKIIDYAIPALCTDRINGQINKNIMLVSVHI
jgi:hypothetical protein